MPPYNPVNEFYFRNAQPYQQQFNFPPPQNIPNVNCRFVTNRDEAKASMIDGFSYNVFLDSSNGKIYLKKLNNNGVSDFFTYSIEEDKGDPMTQINDRLTRIESIVGGMKNESVSNDVGYVKSEPVSNTAIAKQNERYDETKSTSVSENAGNGWRKK